MTIRCILPITTLHYTTLHYTTQPDNSVGAVVILASTTKLSLEKLFMTHNLNVHKVILHKDYIRL